MLEILHGRVCHALVIFNTNVKFIFVLTLTEVCGWIAHITATIQAVHKTCMSITSKQCPSHTGDILHRRRSDLLEYAFPHFTKRFAFIIYALSKSLHLGEDKEVVPCYFARRKYGVLLQHLWCNLVKFTHASLVVVHCPFLVSPLLFHFVHLLCIEFLLHFRIFIEPFPKCSLVLMRCFLFFLAVMVIVGVLELVLC